MKKIILTFGAVLAFGMASAQTNPQQLQTDKNPMPGKTDVVQKEAQQQAVIKPDARSKQAVQGDDQVQSRKDEMVTNDHVKSTSVPEKAKKTAGKKKAGKVKKA